MGPIGLDVPHGEDNTAVGVYDSGAVGGGQQEHNKGEGMVNRLVKDFRALGRGVVVSRGRRGGRWLTHAKAKSAIVLSPHMNAGKGRGVECWVHPFADKRTANVAALIAARVSRAAGIPNRGVKRKAFAIFRYRKTVIVEMAFIDNPKDLAAFNAHVDEVELAILNGTLVGLGLQSVKSLPRKG